MLPEETKCFRFLAFLGDIEQMPVPLLFGVENLYLQFSFMGTTTTLPLEIDGATLQSIRLPGTPTTLKSPAVGDEKAAARKGAARGVEGATSNGADGDWAKKVDDAAGADDEGDTTGDDVDDGDKGDTADTGDTADNGAGATGGIPKDGFEGVRVKRSLFSGQAEKKRREGQAAAEAEQKRVLWEKENAKRAAEEAARKKAEERRKAEEAIRKAEEARMKAEAEVTVHARLIVAYICDFFDARRHGAWQRSRTPRSKSGGEFRRRGTASPRSRHSTWRPCRSTSCGRSTSSRSR